MVVHPDQDPPSKPVKPPHGGESWTRVLLGDQQLGDQVATFDVGEDLVTLARGGSLNTKPNAYAKPWRPLYQNTGQELSSSNTGSSLQGSRLTRE